MCAKDPLMQSFFDHLAPTVSWNTLQPRKDRKQRTLFPCLLHPLLNVVAEGRAKEGLIEARGVY